MESPAVFGSEAPGPNQVRTCRDLFHVQWLHPAATKVCLVIEALAYVGACGLHLGQRRDYRISIGIVIGKNDGIRCAELCP